MGKLLRRGSDWPSTDIWDPVRLMLGDRGEGERPQGMFMPEIDVKETGDSFLMRADLPGVRSEDIDISVIGNRLTLSGKREEEKRQEGEQFYAYECNYGSFTRSFLLPDAADTDNIEADLTNGVLSVKIPKRVDQQARQIKLGAEAQKGLEGSAPQAGLQAKKG